MNKDVKNVIYIYIFFSNFNGISDLSETSGIFDFKLNCLVSLGNI